MQRSGLIMSGALCFVVALGFDAAASSMLKVNLDGSIGYLIAFSSFFGGCFFFLKAFMLSDDEAENDIEAKYKSKQPRS